MRPRIFRLIAPLACCAVLAACQAPQTTTPPPAAAAPSPPPPLATPVKDGTLKDNFNNIFCSGETYLAGYPTAAGLRAMQVKGVTRVIALKTNDQVLDARGYDEAAVAARLGLDLVVIPMSVDTMSPADVARFAQAYDSAKGPVLVHCGSANTVGALWAAYLHERYGLPEEEAIAAGDAAGMKAPDAIKAAKRLIEATPASTSK